MLHEPQTRLESEGASRALPLLLILFTASGFSALIYEIVWYQLLQLAIGSTAISLGILLATFMGGLCLGSIAIPRFRAARERPLAFYALLELGMGFCAILVLFGIPYIDRVYFVAVGYGLPGMFLRAFLCAVCLLPPTALMGASLPVLARWTESSPRGMSWWGLLYCGNTAGAVFGCLFAGFYLLRIYNVSIATYVAAAVNLLVAAASLILASRFRGHVSAGRAKQAAPSGSEREASAPIAASRWTIYVAIAISGMTALGAEVVWTRLMGMMMGSTVYVFSIILAVFLVGLAFGGAVGALLLRVMDPRLALGWCQILLCAAIAWSAYMISASLPYWPINTFLSATPWYTFQLDLARCFWAILPATLLWGASFPLALAAVAAPGEDSGSLVGGIYAANTFGAIAGALTMSLALVPWIGTQQSQRLLLVLLAMGALLALAPYLRQFRPLRLAAGIALAMVLGGVFAWLVKPIPGEVIAYGRQSAMKVGQSTIIYTAEGRNSSVAISEWDNGALGIDVNGHVEATTELYDMKLQRMIGHLPALLHPHPQSVLGIGFGAGVSAGTFTTYPSIEKITICEIEPLIPPLSTRYFAPENNNVMNNPRTRIVYDDARHYLLTTRDKFDIIASDPLDVFVKGTAALYSKEYFEAVKRHLNPGGMFTLYVPLYQSDLKTVQSELATFFDAFPNGTMWANTRNGEGYDMVFMGQLEPLRINLDEVEQRLQRDDYAAARASLREIGFTSAVGLFSTFSAQDSDLRPWLQNAEITRDRDLRLQYLAGWSIDSQLESVIYNEMLKYRRPPKDLFSGSPQSTQLLLGMLSASFRGGSQP